MKYIVYLTKNLVNGKIYVGVHKTENPDVFDGYFGNGLTIKDLSKLKHPKEPFHYAVKKYGFKNFKRSTIKIFNKLEGEYAYSFKSLNECAKYLNISLGSVQRAFYAKWKIGNFYINNEKLNYYKPEKLELEGDYHLYSLEGNYIQTFESRLQLINYFKCNMDGVNLSIRMGKPYKEYLWRRGTKLDSVKPYLLKQKTRKVGQYTLSGELVRIYDTVRAARQDFSNINKVLKGTAKLCKGYTFKYMS